jgi:putative oxidoreductase
LAWTAFSTSSTSRRRRIRLRFSSSPPSCASHFAAFFFAVQLIGGLLLLSGFFVPLALTVLAAELYNILAFHLTLSPGIALAACVLWLLVFLQYRNSFNGVLAVKPMVQE